MLALLAEASTELMSRGAKLVAPAMRQTGSETVSAPNRAKREFKPECHHSHPFTDKREGLALPVIEVAA
jgi:hypothetical protein